MREEQKNEFIDLLNKHAGNLKYREFQTRSLDTVVNLFIYATSIGAFSGLWNVIQLWVKRYSNASVKIQ
jgi:hypothetical protein